MTDEATPLFSYTQTDAAKAVGLSRSTIRRRREHGHFPNSWKTKDGEWMIPEIDLLTDGLELALSVDRDTRPTEPASSLTMPTPPSTVPTAPAQPDLELIQALHRAELAAAEARAQAGIERARADGLQSALEEARARAEAEGKRAEGAEMRASDAARTVQMIELFKRAEDAGELEAPKPQPEPVKKGFWKTLWDA